MPELSAVAIFEVDRQATHDYKARRFARNGHRLSPATPVAVSFGTDSLPARLLSAGFDPRKVTLWVLEGVTVYLTVAVTAELLNDIAGLSTPASHLVLSYISPSDARPPWFMPVARAFGSVVGEPFRGLFTPADLRRTAQAAGFDVVRDDSPAGWLAEPARGRPVLERVCLLVRRSGKPRPAATSGRGAPRSE